MIMYDVDKANHNQGIIMLGTASHRCGVCVHGGEGVSHKTDYVDLALLPRTFFGGEALGSFCAARRAETRPSAAWRINVSTNVPKGTIDWGELGVVKVKNRKKVKDVGAIVSVIPLTVNGHR